MKRVRPFAPYARSALYRVARRLPPHRDEARLTDGECAALAGQLAQAVEQLSWHPSPARHFTVPKPNGGARLLGKQARRDRVLQRAMLTALDAGPAPPRCVTSYVRGRGPHDTIAAIERRLRAGAWVWSLDVVDFFPSVNLDHLASQVKASVHTEPTRTLVLRSLQQPVRWRVEDTPRLCRGLLQGGVLSGWLSNVALADIDARFAAGGGYHRYCDNLFVCGPRDQVRAQVAELVAACAARGLRVRLRPREPASPSVGVDCLGHRVSALGRAPGKGRMRRFLRRALARLSAGQRRAATQLVQGHRAFYQDRTWRAVMEIDDLLRAGRFAEARALIRAAQDQLEIVDEALELSAEETRRLLDAVGGDPARHVINDARERRMVGRGITQADLARHRRGDLQLGVLPVDSTGHAHVGVIDLDAPERGAAPTVTDALALARAARAQGQPALVEDTGGRGHHVWLPTGAAPAADITARLEALCRSVDPSPGVRREIFPAMPDADPSIRLPLGVHPRTGRHSTLLDLHGAAIVDEAALRQVLRPPSRAVVTRSPSTEAVLAGCPLLAALAEEARMTHDLSHDGRYSLASVLNTVPGGVEAVHQIIGACSDYDHAITQHFIDRLHPRPLGCRRLKERHPHLADRCRCPRAARPYPSPAFWARRAPVTPARRLSRADMERLLAGVQRSLTRMRGLEEP